jgi:hypothetical protein
VCFFFSLSGNNSFCLVSGNLESLIVSGVWDAFGFDDIYGDHTLAIRATCAWCAIADIGKKQNGFAISLLTNLARPSASHCGAEILEATPYGPGRAGFNMTGAPPCRENPVIWLVDLLMISRRCKL